MLERYVDTAAGDYPLRGGLMMLVGVLILVSVTISELLPMVIGASPSFGRAWLRSGQVIELCLLPAAGLIALIEGAHIAAFEAGEDEYRERSIINYWSLHRISGFVTTVAFLSLLTWGMGSFIARHDSGFLYSIRRYIRWMVGPEWSGHEYSFLYFSILLAPCFLFIIFQKRLCAKIALYMIPFVHVALYFLFPGRFMSEVS